MASDRRVLRLDREPSGHLWRGIGEATLHGMAKHLIVLLLGLHMAHVPVPVPDLDGEWQGVEIGGLSDSRAWGIVLLGVCPNDDVDHGPVRSEGRPGNLDPVESPFGLAIVTDAVPLSQGVVTMLCGCHAWIAIAAEGGDPLAVWHARYGDLPSVTFSPAGASRAMRCVWHI
jgi:hypothetical protein